MKPKQLHQEAMHYSFLAKQSLDNGEDAQARDYYTKAAEIESQVARFYYDKPDLEPTRGMIVRSAAFLNLKAGLIAEGQTFIFWGLLNLQDEMIKAELTEALELSIALKNTDAAGSGHNVDYWNGLRQRSVYYTLEPAKQTYGSAVSLEMLKDFSENYLKSLKAYAVSTFIKLASKLKNPPHEMNVAIRHFESLVNPLVTTSAIGSFKFSIANDFLARAGEDSDIVRLKSTVLTQYHERIFINPLDDAEIGQMKEEFKEEEINQIFRPIAKIKSPGSMYKVAYYDSETLRKMYLPRIVNEQKRKLLPPSKVSADDIGYLESLLIHARDQPDGKTSRSVILREQLKSFELDTRVSQIEVKDKRPLMLSGEISIAVHFDADKGFTFSFDDLNVQYTDTEYGRGLQGLQALLYEKVFKIAGADKNVPTNAAQMKILEGMFNDTKQLGG